MLDEREQALLNSVVNNLDEILLNQNPKPIGYIDISNRFSSAIWYEEIQKTKIVVGGCGGIGSFLVFLLSRVNPLNITVFDPDDIDYSNLSGQLFALKDVNNSKCESISRFVREYSSYYHIHVFKSLYTNDSLKEDVMICGFDNMAARKVFFENWLSRVNSKLNPKDMLFIDGKLAAEEFEILCIKGDDKEAIERYQREFLFSDEEAAETTCSYKQTTFMTNMIASYMVNLFVNFIANKCNPVFPRDVPFYTYYNCKTMYLKQEM